MAKGWIQGLNGPPNIDDEGVAGELENYIQPFFSLGIFTRNRFSFIRGVMFDFPLLFLVPVILMGHDYFGITLQKVIKTTGLLFKFISTASFQSWSWEGSFHFPAWEMLQSFVKFLFRTPGTVGQPPFFGCRECSEAAIKHLFGGLVEPTHLKNMRRSNWIMNPQISA